MKKIIITIVALLAILSILIYGYEFIFKKPIIESPTITPQDNVTETIEIKEQYKNSVYTFAGSIDLPTPCHSITEKVNQISESKYEIEINIIAPDQDTMCAQVITPKTYKVSFTAGPDIIITAKINGVTYELNRFLIPNDQNIDTFKLEIKG